ncbi:shikimate kinase [Lutibacter sp. Hel_I_33_5]|uniref:shikimate kinase n=1 Tax=Lutibacter sp. Hel_I_33_5 TaxID=1566289 RepID=UPI00119FD89E|nr:shikimate kinase [Lutibacter sp. Hel_I_33_5]TVZ54956.1 shikimate kinase [Lutibacter sp. Hel_I_33_5]
MKIVLLGYMTSGKSSIGKRLAKKLALPFKDLDDYIETKENKSIKEIFADKGEIYFRLKETEYLKELLSIEDSFILSLGGGTPCYSNNMEFILKNKNTTSIYLKASIHKITNRLIKKKQNRPLVANLDDDKILEFVGKHLFERSSFYEKASIIVTTDNKTKKEIAKELKVILQ